MESELKKTVFWHMAHRIYEYEGLCGEIHGHTYSATAVCLAKVDQQSGISIDFNKLAFSLRSLTEDVLDHSILLDHRDPIIEQLSRFSNRLLILNANTTAENIAGLIFNHLYEKFPKELRAVEVKETSTAQACIKGITPGLKLVDKPTAGGKWHKPAFTVNK